MEYDKIGNESLSAFVKTVQKVILENNDFDHIITASDSGNLAVYIVKEIYKILNKKIPEQSIFPIFRHVDKERTIVFDNTIQKNAYLKLENSNFGDTLFVDDEIWHANTLNGMLDLLISLSIKIKSLTIIAEDGGFKHQSSMRGIPTKYIRTKYRVPEIYNAFSYIIPLEFQNPLKEIFKNEPILNQKQIMCTLLNLPVKARVGGVPYFSTHIVDLANANIPKFREIQIEYEKWFKNIIKNYIQ